MPDQAPTDESMRLQKFLSQAGVCSRRKGEELMRAGRVTVNGQAARELGTQVVPGKDVVAVDGAVVRLDTDLVYVAVNKPRGVITSLADPEGRPIVLDLIPKDLPRLWPVGRLDWDSEGLLLMTNDGDLTHLLTHPSSHVEKTYVVKVSGQLAHDDPGLERMRQGLLLDDGFETSTAEVNVERHTKNNTWVNVVLHEGHNRQIRRMCDAVGLNVMRLRRVAIGPLFLEGLKPGHYRFLLPEEVKNLYAAAGQTPPDELADYSPDKVVGALDRKRKAEARAAAAARRAGGKTGGARGKTGGARGGKGRGKGASKKARGSSKKARGSSKKARGSSDKPRAASDRSRGSSKRGRRRTSEPTGDRRRDEAGHGEERRGGKSEGERRDGKRGERPRGKGVRARGKDKGRGR